MRKNIDRKMETLRPANYHPVPAIRRHKLKSINGVQQQQKINAGSSIAQKIDHAKPVVSSLARNSPVTKVKKPTSPIVKKSDAKKKDVLSDDDDFSKLTFDDTELSLEDEIFEELEKVAHDEAKLNAAIQNFDKILSEYKTKEVNKMMETAPAKPSAIPKPLQKSKTCSIIESKCILKKKLQQQEEKKVNKPIRVENVESVTHAGYYQLTKSLWNLEDFDNFAKSAKHSPAARKTSEGTLSKAKSVWEVSSQSPRPTISRQSSISKIPIKSSSNLSTSMLQLNSSSITMVINQQNGAHHHAMGRYNLSSKKSSVYASTLGLSSPFTNHQSLSQKAPPSSAIRRSSLTAAKSSSSISNYAETKASLQRRNFMNSKTSLPKSALAKSEMSIHGKCATKAQKSEQKKRDSNCSETLLDKCLVKGQELLRKVEEFNDGSSNATKTSIVVRKRDYIAKPTQQLSKNQDVSMHTKMRSVVNEFKAITNENEKKLSSVVIRTSAKEVPTLESCNVISEVVLGAESQESIDKLKEDYESDDSGHISNENEEVIAMELKKSPRKISEELLEIFEKKSTQQQNSSSSTSPQLASKAKVIELNHVNLIKSSMEIYPTCKSEVTIFIKQY